MRAHPEASPPVPGLWQEFQEGAQNVWDNHKAVTVIALSAIAMIVVMFIAGAQNSDTGSLHQLVFSEKGVKLWHVIEFGFGIAFVGGVFYKLFDWMLSGEAQPASAAQRLRANQAAQGAGSPQRAPASPQSQDDANMAAAIAASLGGVDQHGVQSAQAAAAVEQEPLLMKVKGEGDCFVIACRMNAKRDELGRALTPQERQEINASDNQTLAFRRQYISSPLQAKWSHGQRKFIEQINFWRTFPQEMPKSCQTYLRLVNTTNEEQRAVDLLDAPSAEDQDALVRATKAVTDFTEKEDAPGLSLGRLAMAEVSEATEKNQEEILASIREGNYVNPTWSNKAKEEIEHIQGGAILAKDAAERNLDTRQQYQPAAVGYDETFIGLVWQGVVEIAEAKLERLKTAERRLYSSRKPPKSVADTIKDVKQSLPVELQDTEQKDGEIEQTPTHEALAIEQLLLKQIELLKESREEAASKPRRQALIDHQQTLVEKYRRIATGEAPYDLEAMDNFVRNMGNKGEQIDEAGLMQMAEQCEKQIIVINKVKERNVIQIIDSKDPLKNKIQTYDARGNQVEKWVTKDNYSIAAIRSYNPLNYAEGANCWYVAFSGDHYDALDRDKVVDLQRRINDALYPKDEHEPGLPQEEVKSADA